MLRPEALELWREALSEAESELHLSRVEAGRTARRVARSMADATRDEPMLRHVHLAAHHLDRADDQELPQAVRSLLEAIDKSESAAPPDAGAILIVDDDAVTRRILDKAMASTGRRVIHAATAAEAQRWLERERLALVLLDLVLPDADGRTVLMNIRSTPRTAGVPVYVLSGQVGAMPRAECLALGADGFFEKPFNPQTFSMEMRAAIQQADERRREALRDPLTRLPNRAALGELFETLSAQSARADRPMALAVIDLDDLKGINDSMGHPAGDQAIGQFARVVHDHLRAADVLARWGGDEFVALTPGLDAKRLAEVLERCFSALRERPLTVAGHPPRVMTFSAGVADVRPGMSLEEAIVEADRRVYAAKAAGRARVVAESSAPHTARPTVLLAEDDAVTAAIVRHRLSHADFEVVHAADGLRAWEVLEKNHIAVAVLDVQMPGIDGIDLLRRIRQDPRLGRLPVVMLTALGSEDDVVRAFDAGASDYVAKPFSPLELVKRINRLLKR